MEIMSDKQHINVTIELDKDSSRDWARLRRWLKVLLRGYGLKCISVEPATCDSVTDSKSVGHTGHERKTK